MSRLPRQNVIVIAAILFAGELAVERLTGNAWPLAAALACGWVAVILAARWIARFALRAARRARYYGTGVILLASALAALAQPLDNEICTRIGCAMRIRFCSTFLLLLLTAPWFIRKDQFASLQPPSPP